MINKLVVFLSIVLLIFSLAVPVFAVSSYDNTYSDAYQSFYNIYGAVQNDFVIMLNSMFNSSVINKYYARQVINYINNSDYISYFYYNQTSSYNNASPLDKSNFYIIFLRKGTYTFSSTAYDYYNLAGIGQYEVVPNNNKTFKLFRYNSLAQEWDESDVQSAVYIPLDVVNYISPTMTSWLTAYSSGDVGSMQNIVALLGSIDEDIQEGNETAKEIKDFLTDDSVDSNSMDTDVPSFSGGATVDAFFSSLFGSIKTNLENIDSSVSTVSLPVPFTNKSIVLRSDMISSHIEDSAIYTIIQACYWFGFSIYIILSCHKIMEWLQSGEVAEKGVSSFIKYLDDNNPIIKSTMM